MVDRTNVGAAARPSRQHYLRFPLRSDGPVWTLQVVLAEVILNLMQPDTSGFQPAGNHAVRGVHSLNDIYSRASPYGSCRCPPVRTFPSPWPITIPITRIELLYRPPAFVIITDRNVFGVWILSPSAKPGSTQCQIQELERERVCMSIYVRILGMRNDVGASYFRISLISYSGTQVGCKLEGNPAEYCISPGLEVKWLVVRWTMLEPLNAPHMPNDTPNATDLPVPLIKPK